MYSIEYIKGSSNVVADQLSRLLELPDSDWTNMDVDDDTVHPFLLLFPTLHAVQQIQPMISGTTDDSWAEEELRLNTDTDRLHERILFTRHSLTVDDVVITFSPQQYLDCKDFSTLYNIFLKAGDAANSERDAAARLLTQVDHDDDLPDEQAKDKHAGPDFPEDSRVEPAWNTAQRKLLSLFWTCFLRDGYLYRLLQNQELLCVPNVDVGGVPTRFDIIGLFHDAPWAGHRGVQYTYQTLRRCFYWPRMRQDVETFISSCSVCQMNKKNRQKPQGEMQTLQIPKRIFQSYNIDFLTDLPAATEAKYDMLMIVVDHHSTRLFAIPTWKRSTGSIVAEQFYDEICA